MMLATVVCVPVFVGIANIDKNKNKNVCSDD